MEIKEYLTKELKSKISSATELDKTIKENGEKISTIGLSVSSRKRNEKELKASDVANDLKELQEKHFTNFFLEQSMKTMMSEMKLMNQMAQDLELELDLENEEKMILNFVIENNTDLYTMRNGKLEVTNNEIFKQVQDGMKAKLSDDKAIEAVFNSIQ